MVKRTRRTVASVVKAEIADVFTRQSVRDAVTDALKVMVRDALKAGGLVDEFGRVGLRKGTVLGDLALSTVNEWAVAWVKQNLAGPPTLTPKEVAELKKEAREAYLDRIQYEVCDVAREVADARIADLAERYVADALKEEP